MCLVLQVLVNFKNNEEIWMWGKPISYNVPKHSPIRVRHSAHLLKWFALLIWLLFC